MDYRNLTKNLGQLFFEWTQKYLENIALVQLNDKNELTTVTYRQLKADADALCNFLQENGIQKTTASSTAGPSAPSPSQSAKRSETRR